MHWNSPFGVSKAEAFRNTWSPPSATVSMLEGLSVRETKFGASTLYRGSGARNYSSTFILFQQFCQRLRNANNIIPQIKDHSIMQQWNCARNISFLWRSLIRKIILRPAGNFAAIGPSARLISTPVGTISRATVSFHQHWLSLPCLVQLLKWIHV